MPPWLTALFQFLKDNPSAIADLLEIVKRVIALFEKHPELASALAARLKS